MVNSKIFDVTDWKTNNSDVSRSNDNETVKLGMLLVYNMKSIFLQKSYTTLVKKFEILGNICIVVTCPPVCDVTNFELNDSFLIKPNKESF